MAIKKYKSRIYTNIWTHGRLSKYLMAKLDDEKQIEYWFIDVFGDRVEVVPTFKILGGTFINCLVIRTNEQLTIHRSRIKWKIIQ